MKLSILKPVSAMIASLLMCLFFAAFLPAKAEQVYTDNTQSLAQDVIKKSSGARSRSIKSH